MLDRVTIHSKAKHVRL